MQRGLFDSLITGSLLAALLLAMSPLVRSAHGQSDVLGLYWHSERFDAETATIWTVPGYAKLVFLVLTEPSGSLIDGYEVCITSTASDFEYLSGNYYRGWNLGTQTNHLVTFPEPLPVTSSGTVLDIAYLITDLIVPRIVSFGPSSPSSLPAGMPVVVYSGMGPVACSYPFGTPVVAWLNSSPVDAAAQSWGSVKALFR